MRALFLVPPSDYNRRRQPIDRVYGCNYGFDYKPPIHMLQVASFLHARAGWQIHFLDCPAEGVDAASFEAWLDREAGQVDVVCAWAVYLSAEEDMRAMAEVRRRNPAVKSVYMGTAATWKPEEFLQADATGQTFCLLGEAEITLLELAEHWSDRIFVDDGPGAPREPGRSLAWKGAPLHPSQMDGLAWRDNTGSSPEIKRGAFRQLLDVSRLPIPDRRLLRGKYRANRLPDDPITTAVFSRGCGFRCTFCTPNAIDQQIELEYKRLQPTYVERPPLRKRTVDQIVEELEQIAALGYRSVEIADNIFTWGKARTQEICDRIAPLGLKWICLARANMLHDPPTIQAMARAGCRMVYMGSESFDDGLLDDMQKDLKVKDVMKAVEVCRANGVEPEVSVLMGASPNETWRSLLHSWRVARSLKTPFVHYSVVLPSPSTELYDQAIQNGWFIHGDFTPTDNAREVIVNLPNLSAQQLRFALKFAYGSQYLHPRALWLQLQSVRNPDQLRHKLQSGLRLLSFLGDSAPPPRPPIPPGRVSA
jgi:anaerobic magnesium-protoporphyrin IX monomethyl ester cyclase